MHSICHVVLPDNLSLNYDNVYSFVKNHIMKYYSELEVEPYKRLFSVEETLEIAKRRGFCDLADFEEYLKKRKGDEGIENGLYYWITTFNMIGRWDSIRLTGIKAGYELKNECFPYSVVTPDAIWHSEMDYGYKPILDFTNNFKQHPKNFEPEKMWKNFVNDFFNEYANRNLAIIDVHS